MDIMWLPKSQLYPSISFNCALPCCISYPMITIHQNLYAHQEIWLYIKWIQN